MSEKKKKKEKNESDLIVTFLGFKNVDSDYIVLCIELSIFPCSEFILALLETY